MPNIYNLTKEYADLYGLLLDSVDEETGEVDNRVNQLLEIKESEIQTKAVNIACVYKKINATEEEIDKQLEVLKHYKEKCQKAKDRLKNSLTYGLSVLNCDKVDGINAQISFRKSTQTIIENEDLIPDEFKKAKTTITVDRTMIKTAIQQGIEVKGARLEEVKNIQIK